MQTSNIVHKYATNISHLIRHTLEQSHEIDHEQIHELEETSETEMEK